MRNEDGINEHDSVGLEDPTEPIPLKTLEEFCASCEARRCLRRQKIIKSCSTNYRRKNCYNIWNRETIKLEQKRDAPNPDKLFREKVWLEEAGFYEGSQIQNWRSVCKIWAIMTNEEKRYLDKHFKDDQWLNTHVDVCHVLPKSTHPEKQHDTTNVYLAGRLFHSRLTDCRHPVTNQPITNEEVGIWNLKALQYKLTRGKNNG